MGYSEPTGAQGNFSTLHLVQNSSIRIFMVPECSSNRPLVSAADLHPRRRIWKLCCHQQHDLFFNCKKTLEQFQIPGVDTVVLFLILKMAHQLSFCSSSDEGTRNSQTPNRNTVWRLKILHKHKRSLKRSWPSTKK